MSLALSAAPALAVPTANLYAVPSGGASSGSYPNACTQSAPCTLAWAIQQSNSNSALDGYAVTINLAAGTYTGGDTIQASGDTPYSVSLLGASVTNPSATVLSGNGARTLYVNGVSYPVTIQYVTIEDGNSGSSDGGNLLAAASAGTYVTLAEDVVTGGSSSSGGQADVTSGVLQISSTTVESSGSGTYGSLVTGSGSLRIDNSTYSDNSAAGIDTSGNGYAIVEGSTLVGNVNALASNSGQTTTVSDSTISGNLNVGLYVGSGAIDISKSILASNNLDCFGAATDAGNNVLDDSSCGFGTSLGSKVFTTAQIGLQPLANNGGYTETERITASSVAHDFLPTVSDCENDDQRGIIQLQPGKTDCDAGAYQYAPPTLTAVSPASIEPGSTSSINLTGVNLNYATASFGSANVPAKVDNASATGLNLAVPSAALLPLGSEPITVTNADGSATIGFTAVGPTIGALASTQAALGQPYSETFPLTGGEYPVTFSVSSGSLPAGLTLSSGGTISGTPTTAGTSSFTVKLVDNFGVTVTSPESLTVLAPKIRLASSKAIFRPGTAVVSVACGAAPCSGYGKLTLTKRVKVKVHGKTKTKSEKVVLAEGRYLVKADASGGAFLSYTRAGVRERTLLRHSKGSARATVSLTVNGGVSLTGVVELHAEAGKS